VTDVTECVRAVTAHQIPARAPLQVTAGQRVTVGERDTHWPAFVFVTADNGSGWVPSRDMLTVLARDDASGWLWAKADGGREGWVPMDTVQALP
jgi:hypothetical protein